jgi:Protein of unknown function (DUF3309)
MDRFTATGELLALLEWRRLAMGLLLVLLLFLAVFAAPAWPYSAGWGYYPSGGALLLLLILAFVFFSRPRRTI